MSATLNAAVTVISPPARSTADATHQHGLIFRVATSATSGQATAADVPVECRGRYWRFLSAGASTQFAFLLDEDKNGAEDTAPTLVYNQLSATGTGSAAAAQTLVDGSADHIFVPSNVYGVVFISSSGSGFFEASISGAKTAVASR